MRCHYLFGGAGVDIYFRKDQMCRRAVVVGNIFMYLENGKNEVSSSGYY